jgi:hypothetical protein
MKFFTQTEIAAFITAVKMYANDAVKSHTANQCGVLLKTLIEGKYSHFQNHPRMIKLIEKLKPIAVM